MDARELPSPARDASPVAQIRTELARLHGNWSLPLERSREPGRSGLAFRVRRCLERAARPFLSGQVRFNAALMRLLEALERQWEVSQTRLAALERGLEDLARAEEEQARTEQRVAALEELGRRVDRSLGALALDLERRVGPLEREFRGARASVEVMLARLQELVAHQEERGAAAAGATEGIARLRTRTRGVAGLSFEDLHRGPRSEIKERQRVYLPWFAGADSSAPVLDLGCGRGEFLELAREAGLAAEGLDHDPEMVAAGRERGLVVHEGDALEHLRARAAGSLGGILLSQVIEHLTLDQMTELVGLAASRLRPGAAFIAETVNPECLSTFAGAFYLDLTHIRPIHPEAACFLWRWAGLRDVEILRLAPHDERERLEQIGGVEGEWAHALNRNTAKLNGLLFGYRDYAVVGRK